MKIIKSMLKRPVLHHKLHIASRISNNPKHAYIQAIDDVRMCLANIKNKCIADSGTYYEDSLNNRIDAALNMLVTKAVNADSSMFGDVSVNEIFGGVTNTKEFLMVDCFHGR